MGCGFLEKARCADVDVDIPFAAIVEVGTDATAYEQLVAWGGRDPNWQPA